MAIIKDNKNFNVTLKDNDTDWFSLLQFCICKVNPRYYKNIKIKKSFKENKYELEWNSLNEQHTYCYRFPEKVTNETIKKLIKQLPKYIEIDLNI